jgi:hypothetical protein
MYIHTHTQKKPKEKKRKTKDSSEKGSKIKNSFYRSHLEGRGK